MSVPTVALNETTPAGSSYIRVGDNYIREYKKQVREVLEVDHNFPSSGVSASGGYHKQLHLTETADMGTGATGFPLLGAQTEGGAPELVYTDEADDDVQITAAGYIALDKGRLPNATDLLGRNNADDGDINILQVNTDDEIESAVDFRLTGALYLEAGTIMLESTAPTTGANEGAIYTKEADGATELFYREESDGDEIQLTSGGTIDWTNTAFGAWAAKSNDTSYEALTDGIVVASAGNGTCYGYSDDANPPTTERQHDYAATSFGSWLHMTFPVKKGDYWKTTGLTAGSVIIYWVPLS